MKCMPAAAWPLLLACSLCGAGVPDAAPASLPPAGTHPVDFGRDIKPLFETRCISCHGNGQKKGGFRLDSRELVLKGGESGPGARAGKSTESLIVQLVAGADPDRLMPQRGDRLTATEVGVLRAWIDQGMVWDAGVTLGRAYQAPLAPRRPELPPASKKLSNPIDRILAPYFEKQGFRPPQSVGDALFARRAFLDVVGLPPTSAELSAFVEDRGPNKRERLIRRLLTDNQRYAEHWMSFWNDALRNDYRGTGFIDGGRRQITPWLYAALAENMPFDRFVAKLINPDEHSEGFTKGIVWRGAVNASQAPPVQAAQGIAQVFLGINLKCASCHDSFVSNWKLADAYGLASVYAEEPLELVRCDKPMGVKAERRFLFSELGRVQDSTNRAERLASLATVITRPENGRLTRTIVNRLWARLMGRGLVEPVDEMDNLPWNADLLDWLATDLVEHRYDLKHTLELILTSRAYQMPSVGVAEQAQDGFVFKGPAVRRLSAEQYLDTLSALTGTWGRLPANTQIDFTAGAKTPNEPPPAAQWIWCLPNAATAAPPQKGCFRKAFVLTEKAATGLVTATADNRFTLYVNGKEAGSGDDWKKPRVIDIREHLVIGTNVLAVLAENDSPSKEDHSPNPAGLFLRLRLRGAASTPFADLGTDASWLCATNETEGWRLAGFDTSAWRPAEATGAEDTAPWQMAASLRAAWSVTDQYNHVRAALLNNTPLMAALGRPNREQILTTRAPAATTLQALELTNGATLAEWLQRAAQGLLAGSPPEPRKLIHRLFVEGLGRPPSAEELRLAKVALRPPLKPEAVEDLLWALSLHPEFQLIY
jgi:hypothetical protein